MTDESGLNELAGRLDQARLTREAIAQAEPGKVLSFTDAFDVQRRLCALREARGEHRVGVKLAFTNVDIQRKFGLDGPLWGRLMSTTQIADGAEVVLAQYLKPRFEPEIAFILKHALGGEVDEATAAAAVSAVMPAIEVIDSRYRDFKLSLPDLVADNASAAGFVLGTRAAPGVDYGAAEMVLEVDGHIVQRGSSAAIMGHPIRSVVAAARFAALAGETLPAGTVIMAGCATEPLQIAAGSRLRLIAPALGQVSLVAR